MTVTNALEVEELSAVQMSLSLLVGAAAIVGNVLLIHAVRMQSTADRYIHWFVASLGTAGLLGGLVSVTDVIFYLSFDRDSEILCRLEIWFLQLKQVGSVGSVLLIVVDRYLLTCSTFNYGLSMVLPIACLLILWIMSAVLAAIVALNTTVGSLGSHVCFIGGPDSAVGTHLILLLQIIMMVASLIMCVKLHRHRRRIDPQQDDVPPPDVVQIESIEDAGGLHSVHLLMILLSEIFMLCPVIIYTLVYMHTVDISASFLQSGEICFGFGWLFIGDAILSNVLVFGVRNYSRRIFCCAMRCDPTVLLQMFQCSCKRQEDPTTVVPSHNALVPAVLTISQLLRDITSARSRMTSMASTVPLDRRITFTRGSVDINSQLLKQLSSVVNNSSSSDQATASRIPTRVTFQADSAVIVSLSPITEKPESNDSNSNLDADSFQEKANDIQFERTLRQSVTTVHQ